MSVRNGRVMIATTGTAVHLSASSRLVTSVVVIALDTNVSKVAVGGVDAPVTSPQNSPLLAAGESIPFGQVDLQNINVNGSASDGVAYLTEE